MNKKRILIILIIILLLLSSFLIFQKIKAKKEFVKEQEFLKKQEELQKEIALLEKEKRKEKEEELEELKRKRTKERINSKNEIQFVLMGVDAPTIEKSKGTRTDTIMISKVNFDKGSIDIISVPRDTRVQVRNKLDKINHAHAFGGPDLLLESINNFLKTDLEYYVKIDYRSVIEVVDAIGGIEIDVPRRMYYQDPSVNPPLNIDLEPGVQILNGKQSHDFLRWRQNNNGTGYTEGDVGRIKAQQYFMTELIKELLKPKNITKLPTLIKTYYDYVDTNIPLNMILKGITFASNFDLSNVKMHTIPGSGQYIDKISYFIYNVNETNLLIENVLYN